MTNFENHQNFVITQFISTICFHHKIYLFKWIIILYLLQYICLSINVSYKLPCLHTCCKSKIWYIFFFFINTSKKYGIKFFLIFWGCVRFFANSISGSLRIAWFMPITDLLTLDPKPLPIFLLLAHNFCKKLFKTFHINRYKNPPFPAMGSKIPKVKSDHCREEPLGTRHWSWYWINRMMCRYAIPKQS